MDSALGKNKFLPDIFGLVWGTMVELKVLTRQEYSRNSKHFMEVEQVAPVAESEGDLGLAAGSAAP